MHRLKCRNCLMFVTTNIRVLYVHWNECVRKKRKVKCVLTAIVLGLCRYFLTYVFKFKFSCLIPPSLHHLLAPFLCGLSLKIGMGSSGKVFHGSEETIRIVFKKFCFE